MIDGRLQAERVVKIRQKRELVELLGFEARNQYAIETEGGEQIAFAAEQSVGIGALIGRQIFGHWRKFVIHLYGPDKQEELQVHHPFRFYFERIDVQRASGEHIGSIERQFSLVTKKFSVEDASGRVVMTVASPFWRIWTFRFFSGDRERAVIAKKWSGLGTELFLDADTFAVSFIDPSLTVNERLLLLAAGLFIDIRYFEKKGNGGPLNLFDFLPGGE